MTERRVGVGHPIDSEREIGLLMRRHRINPAEIQDLRRVICTGIKLRQFKFEHPENESFRRGVEYIPSPAIEQAIIEEITQSIYYAAKCRRISMPDEVGLWLNVGDDPQIVRGYVDGNLYATAGVDDKHPNGSIFFSPHYLLDRAYKMEHYGGNAGFYESLIDDLTPIAAHEAYHIETDLSLGKTCSDLPQSKRDEYESAAVLFGYNFICARLDEIERLKAAKQPGFRRLSLVSDFIPEPKSALI